MTGKTHYTGGVLCSIVGFTLLHKNGLLLDDVNLATQMAIIYPYCVWASKASDFDHHWDSCPDKDIPSWCINKVLHITTPIKKKLDKKLSNKEKKENLLYKVSDFFSASHRSWQTHSDLTLFIVLFLLYAVLNGFFTTIGVIDTAILSLILTGVCLGIVAHFILDMLTPEGVWCLLFVFINKILSMFSGKKVKLLPEKIHFVPKMKCFATDSDWETFINRLLKVSIVVSLLYLIFGVLYPDLIQNLINLFPYEINFK